MEGNFEVNEKSNYTAWEELGISNDFLFCKIMQNPKLCIRLLQRILPGLEIDHIEYPELQKGIALHGDAKGVRLDVYVRDNRGTVYDMELQVTDTKELPKRTRYYQGMIDLQTLDKGRHYKQLKPSYIIFICTFDLFGKGRHIYTFENICKEDNSIPLGDGTTKIFLNAGGRQNDVSRELEAFLDYVAGKKTGDVFVEELDNAVRQAKQNREWRHEYMTLLMRDQENFEKGIEKGMEKGIEKGKIWGAVSTYRDFGLSDEVISKKLQEKYHLSEDETMEYLQVEMA